MATTTNRLLMRRAKGQINKLAASLPADRIGPESVDGAGKAPHDPPTRDEKGSGETASPARSDISRANGQRARGPKIVSVAAFQHRHLNSYSTTGIFPQSLGWGGRLGQT